MAERAVRLRDVMDVGLLAKESGEDVDFWIWGFLLGCFRVFYFGIIVCLIVFYCVY